MNFFAFAIWIFVLFFIVSLWRSNKIFPVPLWWWQYLRLLRVPLIATLILLIFPFLAITRGSSLFGNLFVMRDAWQLGFTIVGTTVASLMVALVFSVIFINAPERYSIDLEGKSPWTDNARKIFQKLNIRYALAILIALPTAVITIVVSAIELEPLQILFGTLGGILSSGLLFWGVPKLGERIDINHNSILGEQFFANWVKLFDKGYNKGYFISDNSNEFNYGHLLGLALGIIGLLIYIIVIAINYPGSDILPNLAFFNQIKEAPALFYLLLIIWVATALLGGATFYTDYFRVPLLLFLIIFSAFSYAIFGVDHYFELTTTPTQYSAAELANFMTPIKNRLQNQTSSKDKTLVVVAASGGGIQSAGWTIEVLRGLQQELGSSFTEATGIISSASGGSVGTMFLLDRLEKLAESPSEATIEDKFKQAFQNATEDSLDAVGWGLAYPDLFRSIGLPWAVNKYVDRASAMEQDWERTMATPEATLTSWQKPIMTGKIPIPVFNATLVEDGGRFLISPMKFIPGELSDIVASHQPKYNRQVLDFSTIYHNVDPKLDYDLKVSTAARLSATFPYVSPLARNDIDNIVEIDGEKRHYNYHVADGGYFDNAGLFTTVEWLNDWLDRFSKELNVTKVLILQINAFPESQFNSQNGDLGWVTELIGPLKALYRVRNSTQVARNQEEAQLLQDSWKGKVDIQPFTIFFPEGYKQPLSWKLTQQQKDNLEEAWQKIVEDTNPESTFNLMKNTWKTKWKIPQSWDS